ncbi:MAG: VCBS repeat-containing protein [Bacteroidota bacterium]
MNPLSFSKILLTATLLLSCQVLVFRCNRKSNTEGEKLAKIHCSSCHQFPSPQLLPQNVWEHSTLPYMGILLGIDTELKNLPDPLKPYSILKAENQMVSQADWEKIKEYYLDNSPKKLESNNKEPLAILENLFEVEMVDTKLANSTIPNFTMVSIDTLKRQIIAGDQSNRYIWVIDKNGKPSQIFKDQNALSSIEYSKTKPNEMIMTFMGKTTQANQEVKGYITSNTFNTELKTITTIQQNLDRPVSTLSVNLDQSAENELVVSEFGFMEGGLSILKKSKNNHFTQKYLSRSPGVVKTIIVDFDGDKDLDLVTLFAQGNERIVLYKNKGNLIFEEKQILQFPPIYGSNYFELVDINNDSKLDIVYAAGDNDDFTTILKPYHGIYIFENEGNDTFKQANFFAQNGACKVLPKDYDLDGDVDLISTSLFPDVENRPKEGFIYFENQKGAFIQKTLNINHLGRWAVMDAGDLDGDGDIDLVLGSHPVAKFPSGFDQSWKKGSGLVILRNKKKEPK